MALKNCCILVTGSKGFIGKNLILRLRELRDVTVIEFERGDDPGFLVSLVRDVDAVIHLAGENRPVSNDSFNEVNVGLTSALCKAIESEFEVSGRHVPLVFASSVQVELDNPYGLSKLLAEQEIQNLSKKTGNPCVIFRLPGVFGKWCKPNYNSVVATFCYNLSRDIPIHVSDQATPLRLVHIDDVVESMLSSIPTCSPGFSSLSIYPQYKITLGELAEQIRAFASCRTALLSERVGTGLVRALYSTYVSYLPNEKFVYGIPIHADSRGVFVEMLKTHDSGQFSYLTCHPGVTRGGHYHNAKTEKFLVVKGEALFRFRHLLTNELVELRTSGNQPQIVDTIPGWAHDITNIGNDEMLVLLWANENYDLQKPDTFVSKI